MPWNYTTLDPPNWPKRVYRVRHKRFVDKHGKPIRFKPWADELKRRRKLRRYGLLVINKEAL